MCEIRESGLGVFHERPAIPGTNNQDRYRVIAGRDDKADCAHIFTMLQTGDTSISMGPILTEWAAHFRQGRCH